MADKPLPIKPSWTEKLAKYSAIGIDAMCFIYQFEAHPVFGPPVFHLFSLFEAGKAKGFTSVLSLAEILSAPVFQQKRHVWEEERQRFWQTPNLEAVPVDGKICEAASLIRSRYSLRLPDAIQITTAIFSNAEIFVTNDERLRKIKEVSVVILKDYL